MSVNSFARSFVPILVLLALFALPPAARAGGVCGGAYVVESGETLESIAAKCGTTVSAITAANPGIGSTVSAGQTLTVPGSTYSGYTDPGSVYVSPAYGYGYSYPTNYGSSGYYAPVSYSGTYLVRYGDTFSGIASRYGVSINSLWAANPHIRDINYIYAGQIIHVPGSGKVVVPAATQAPEHLAYGAAPSGTPLGGVRLSNQANSEVYVSLQGTTRDGVSVINEYSVNGTMKVNVPVGWYLYVAWVGGRKYSGNFNLTGNADQTITFFGHKVVAE
jgi:LysM repeat protein